MLEDVLHDSEIGSREAFEQFPKLEHLDTSVIDHWKGRTNVIEKANDSFLSIGSIEVIKDKQSRFKTKI